MRAICFTFALLPLLALGACSPDSRGNGDGDGTIDASGVGGGACVPEPESCGDLRDNDCDGRTDCGDVDCSGVGGCPICGQAELPMAAPLALPDGIGVSTACTTDAECLDPLLPSCVASECHASYIRALDFIGFPIGAKLDDPSKLLAVCAKMEHTWVRDLQIDLITPSEQIITLHAFVGRTGGAIFLGEANDYDSADSPVPGPTYEYCWTATAANTFLNAPTQSWTDSNGSPHAQLPAGDYKTITPWEDFAGAQLNGMWRIRVTDLWPQDNGFIESWSLKFDPTLVSDCSGPIIN